MRFVYWCGKQFPNTGQKTAHRLTRLPVLQLFQKKCADKMAFELKYPAIDIYIWRKFIPTTRPEASIAVQREEPP